MLQRYSHYFKILIIFLNFIIPFALLYYLDAASFEKTWKGRTFYMFFIWLFVLELLLNWGKYEAGTTSKQSSKKKIFTLSVALTLPTVYVIIANFCGLNAKIIELVGQYNIKPPWADWMPLSIEYLAFTALFGLVILLSYGLRGLANFSLSLSLMGAIGALYIIDNLYPSGAFAPFQIIVPNTAALAASVLNLMGYGVTFLPLDPSLPPNVPILKVWNAQGYAIFGIGWPCSGVESLIIYTVTILLFLKKSNISWKQKTAYFVVGAAITYFINALRIASIFVIAISSGWNPWYTPPEVIQFHDYYGPLYSIIWIISYPLIIIGSRILWSKSKDKLKKLFSKRIDSGT